MAQTKAPALGTKEETRWTTFLMRTLHVREPAHVKINEDWEYDIALLLEISSHSDSILFDAADDFLTGPTRVWDSLDKADVLGLIERVKIAFPFKATKEYGPYMMHPLSIENGKLVFVGTWPGFRTGVWLNPFTRVRSDNGETSVYQVNKEEWGLRDLSSFKAQMLTGPQRFKLWKEFKSDTRG